MTYEYAAEKIETLYNRALEHIDRIVESADADGDWLDRSLTARMLEEKRNEFVASSAIVVEMYIELTVGDDKWEKLHKNKWEFVEKLDQAIKGLC